jgi:elongation factor Ts
MANITPQLVKELREKTNAGMGDCKKALEEANGDIKEAVEVLRKKGAASAAKRADRSATEGIIIAMTTTDGKKAILVEVNSETDFVARNEQFESYANQVANAIINSEVTTIEELMTQKVGEDTIQGLHNEILAKFSENISVRRFLNLKTNGFFVSYIHTGSKLAVLVEASLSNPSEKAFSSLRDIAMQIAAMNPLFVDRSNITTEQIQKEIEIYKELAITEGKKPEMAERIAQGRLEKYYQEACLVEQAFVKDANKTINDVIKDISDEAKEEVKILNFKRFFLGESLD